MVMPRQSHVDGKVWTNDVNSHSILRLDLATGAYEAVDPFQGMPIGGNRQHSPYGMTADKDNNLYFMDFGDESVGRVDAKTFRGTIYPTPTAHSRPRRTMLDDKGRLWFAEFAANKLGMFDLERESIKEWDVPTPFTFPYDVYLDKNGELWSRLDVERPRAAVRSARPASRSNTCCRTRPISAASSSTTPRRR